MRRIILAKHKGIVRSSCGRRTVAVRAMQNNPRKMARDIARAPYDM